MKYNWYLIFMEWFTVGLLVCCMIGLSFQFWASVCCLILTIGFIIEITPMFTSRKLQTPSDR